MLAIDGYDSALAAVRAAVGPEGLFGPLKADDEASIIAARSRFRDLARCLHPDVAPDGHTEEAGHASATLNALWDQYKRTAGSTWTVTTKRRTYTVEPSLAQDEISSLFPCSWRDGEDLYGMLRLPRNPKDGDLITAEVKALRILDEEDNKRVPDEPGYRMYMPRTVEAFRHKNPSTGAIRQAHVTERLQGFVTLEEIHSAYPGGIRGRDAAWMWRRMLAGIGWAHRAGIIHGAILPSTVLIQPDLHGVVFINWSYSVPVGGKIPAVIDRFRDMYPEDVLSKQAAHAGIDIDMVARCMLYLLGPTSTQYRAFARGCAASINRGSDAWDIQRDFDDLIRRMYGKRTFTPFPMPTPA